MKLSRHGEKSQISGAVSGPQQFNIVGSNIAFKILSSGLYSNKIQACIRELSCNAWDAHVMGNKRDVPFEIHLPNSFEPWFTVKDFGIGLNPAADFVFKKEVNEANGNEFEVRVGKYLPGAKLAKGHYIKQIDELIDLYCTYFQSNKNDSNDVIGAMGLGSKSPFCYTEGFTVTSRFNGVTRIASAYITEHGTPSIVVQATESTPDAPNGLEVTFPVAADDCWEFENNAKVALEFFTDPAPIMTGEKVTVDSTKYVMKTDRWGMRAKEETHQGTGMRAIQGKVAYAVGKIDISKMGPELQALTAMPLDLFFPIGELQVAASREALQLDPATVANITRALNDVYTGLIEEVKKEIDKCGQAWEARLLIYRLINTPGTGKIVNEALNKGGLDGKYTNFNLNGKKPYLNELDYFHTQIYKFHRNGRSAKYSNKSSIFSRFTPEARDLASMELRNGTKKQKDFNREFDVEKTVMFVINDMKFGGEKYIHYLLQESNDNPKTTDAVTGEEEYKILDVYLFNRVNKDHTVAQVLKEAGSMIELLGNPAVTMMSDLKAKYGPVCDVIAPKKPSVPKERREVTELNFDAKGRKTSRYSYSDYSIPWCNLWKRSETQPDGVTKFYVVNLDNNATESGFSSAKDLITFLKHVKESGLFGLDDTTPIYGLKPKSPLRQDAEWVDVIPYVLNQVATIMTPAKELEMTLHYKAFRIYDWEEAVSGIGKDRSFPKTSTFKKFADTLALAKKNFEATDALYHVACAAERREKTPGVKFYNRNEKNVVDFDKAWTAVKRQYPMLEMSSRCYNTNAIRIVGEYIKMVDAAANTNAKAAGTN